MFGLVLLLTLTNAMPVLRWGGDAEGGAPYVEADPNDPSKLRGFDVEVAEQIAAALGRRPQFVQVAFSSIDQSVARGDFDMGMSGVEDTPARRAALAATMPYFEFREVITVRDEDRNRFRALADFKGRRIGTLGGTIAYDILLDHAKRDGFEPISYDDDVHPYEDLRNGRLDGVLLDHIIAARSMRRTSGLYTNPNAVATGHYIIVLAKGNTALRDKIDEILKAKMRDGTLERIYRKWNIWDEGQEAFFKRSPESRIPNPEPRMPSPEPRAPNRVLAYLPALLRATLITIVLSCASMALAVLVGVIAATSRIYGGFLLRGIFTLYVEITRGTPVLLQLFVIYYGLSSVIRLPAFVAALIGLGLNYAAYESEIYRGAMEAVPRGQLEAARTLGLSEAQVFRLVRGPQAFRLALAPMTNDFVALLKDSSLVSVITVVELTKQTSIFAANIGSWVVPGAICAALYLALSLPLARAARALERRWRMPSE
ncbi:MAG TPA: ABC transporter substrate-binding protein/permease [Thermoanaerobaculia bacterium]|nr:ABC transporter substrate-binding protein/permease [Thermoanaerobaculia bacterium]